MNTDFLSPIDGRLQRIASRFANPEISSDDLYQGMVLGLLEKAQQDPQFTEQKPAYICRKASFIAYNLLRENRYHRKYGKGIDGDKAMEREEIDLVPAHGKTPEKAVEDIEAAFSILDALRGLTETDRAIVKMVYRGLSVGEIAKALNVTPGAITHRRKAIADTARRVIL